jgi:uncharacterized Zn-finger protein
MAEATTTYPKFHNEAGKKDVRIGAREFECIGALPPHDHPHVYLDMGDGVQIICPYCSTTYVYDETLGKTDSVPPGLLYAGGKLTER